MIGLLHWFQLLSSFENLTWTVFVRLSVANANLPQLLLELDSSDGVHWWVPARAQVSHPTSQHCKSCPSAERGPVASSLLPDWVPMWPSSMWFSPHKLLEGRDCIHFGILNTMPSAQWMVDAGYCLWNDEWKWVLHGEGRRDFEMREPWTWEVWWSYRLIIVNVEVTWDDMGWRGVYRLDTTITIRTSFRALANE